MSRPNHNRRIVDLRKVQWAKFFYENQDGAQFSTIPRQHTVHGVTIDADGYAYPHPKYPGETNVERARRLDILDIWEPICILQLTANHQLRYVGEKAKAIWQTWRSKIYGKTS